MAARKSSSASASKTGKKSSKQASKKASGKTSGKTAKAAKTEQKAAKSASTRAQTAETSSKSSGRKKSAVQPGAGKNVELLVIDAHAMAFRAYYALQGQNLTHPVTGQPTHAVFGFLRMFFRVLLDYQPERVAVAWDSGRKTFRTEMYPEYKANRKAMPEDLRPQIDEIKDLAARAGFPVLEAPGFEADDVMGALAKRFGARQRVVLITGDKDCYQLLNKNVSMLRGAKGVTEFTEIDPDWVQRELGVAVDQIPDYMGLVGDSSDNIPGAKGVGPKSAAKLLQEHKSLDHIYKDLTKVENKSLRAKLEEYREQVLLSRDLATIRTDLESIAELNADDLRTPDYTRPEFLQILRQEGYTAVYNELARVAGAGADASGGDANDDASSDGPAIDLASARAAGKIEYTLIQDKASLEQALKELRKDLGKDKLLCVDTETTSEYPMRATLVGVSLCAKPGRAYYVALPPRDGLFSQKGLALDEARPLLQELLEDKNVRITAQNLKYDLLVLANHGIDLQKAQLAFDTMIASYLCNPNVRRNGLDDLALDLLGYTTIKYTEIAGSGRNKTTLDQVEPEKISDYACEDADIAFQICRILQKQIREQKLEKVHDEIELALIPVLAAMEREGVAIDIPYFNKLSKDYEKKLNQLEKKIYAEAGYEFNIASTRELQKILFEDLQLPTGKKTKTGYSTDQSVLEELRGLHPMVDMLLEHRKYSKLKSTYIDALPELVFEPTGRLHTSFNQTIAATGRLSSNEPNLQNIPVREDQGRAIRRGFIPRKGNLLLSLDYSQIELRIMAHYSEDEALIETFTKEHIDVHRRTAASIFDVEEDDVTPDMRAKGKTVNFAIIYGVTEYGLSKQLGVSREEARGYIDRFFDRYPGVRRYMDETIAFAEKHGRVETLSGRIRQIPEINSSNRFRKEGAQRTAINTPIQGASADIIKMAMIRIHADLQKQKLKSKMILQVHDELLFDVLPEEQDAVLKIARSRMEAAMKLRVPLDVDHSFGKNWDEIH